MAISSTLFKKKKEKKKWIRVNVIIYSQRLDFISHVRRFLCCWKTTRTLKTRKISDSQKTTYCWLSVCRIQSTYTHTSFLLGGSWRTCTEPMHTLGRTHMFWFGDLHIHLIARRSHISPTTAQLKHNFTSSAVGSKGFLQVSHAQGLIFNKMPKKGP